MALASMYSMFSRKQDSDSPYEGGEEYAEPKVAATGLADDLKAVGFKTNVKNLRVLLDVALAKGKPLDDRQMTTERLIALLCTLPESSKVRKGITNKLIDTLWDNLQHPPLSYMGGDLALSVSGQSTSEAQQDPNGVVEYTAPNGSCQIQMSAPEPPKGIFQYRTPDGSYNNILAPHLGKAGTPYAKSVRPMSKLQGVRPDPGLLFDLLMARDDEHFHENPAGISSILFYHATMIIHDCFNTNRLDMNVSDTSSYVDLAPLYGSSLQDQLKIRTMQKGLLKPDTFFEKRLLGQPPGVNALLVLYSRYHNYVADTILKINEGGRFTLEKYSTPEEEAKAVAKQDNDLFNVARMVTNGMFAKITLYDYIRAITNSHHSNTNWTLDPTVEIGKSFAEDGTPRGIGNQVSVEFNLLYRFHAGISKRDDKWTTEFLEKCFPQNKGRLNQLTPQDLFLGLTEFEKIIPVDPSKREFGGLKRGPDGKFKDEELVKIFSESMNDPAGSFGARQIPQALRVVEILGILQARKWDVASLNEFREFFGLKRHETMEDINPDPEIADALRNLYPHPDLVELYPGLMIEETKPRMDPGCGICPPYTVGRAVLSDAVTLIRSDRFFTIDLTVANLTNWGLSELTPDHRTLGGSMFYKLIQRTLPGWFPFNSLAVMQPMYTKEMNREIAKEIGTYHLYSEADPAPPPHFQVIAKYSQVSKIMKDQKIFRQPPSDKLGSIFTPKKDFGWYMLAGDKPENTANRNLVGEAIYEIPGFKKLLSDVILKAGGDFLKKEAFQMNSQGLTQIDIIRDVAIPLNARILGDIFYMDLKTPENPNGSLSYSKFYQDILTLRHWGVADFDPASSWNLRRAATEAAQSIQKSTESLHETVLAEAGFTSLIAAIGSFFNSKRQMNVKKGSLRWCGQQYVKKLLAAGQPVDKTASTSWLNAFGGIGVLVTSFAEILHFFLDPKNITHWNKLQELATSGTADADKQIRDYTIEAQRLTNSIRVVRLATQDATIDGEKISKGTLVVLLLGQSARDPDAAEIPDANEFRPGRPLETVTAHGIGPHECLGREIAWAYLAGLVKIAAGLKNLRPAPGEMGQLKRVQVGTENFFLNETWSYLDADASTWKLHFDGYGKGVYTPPKVPVTEGRNLSDARNAIEKKLGEDVEAIRSKFGGQDAAVDGVPLKG